MSMRGPTLNYDTNKDVGTTKTKTPQYWLRIELVALSVTKDGNHRLILLQREIKSAPVPNYSAPRRENIFGNGDTAICRVKALAPQSGDENGVSNRECRG
jgi:hypothetical protein